MNKRISIRDLQKVSTETLESLDGLTPVTSGERTIAFIIPVKRANKERLRKSLARAEALAKGRNVKADDAALEAFGPVDKTNWTPEAVRELQREFKRRK
jgi:hypothetical protein